MQEATFDHGRHLGIPACIAYDPRADGKRRTILLGERYVVIRRRFHGVKMHLAIPFENYRGIEIAHTDDAGGALFRLSLVHRDPDLCVAVVVSGDEAAMTDALRYWTARFTAPDAAEASMDPSSGSGSASGANAFEAPCEAAAAGRRRASEPAALRSSAFSRARNKPCPARHRRGQACIRRPPTMFRGEREIICYE
jgi:hypothetical protein